MRPSVRIAGPSLSGKSSGDVTRGLDRSMSRKLVMSTDAVRWGIMGTGMMATDFTRVLRTAEGAEIAAVGARSQGSASAFADKFNVPVAHAGYEALAADPSVDIIYIATLPDSHAALAEMCLRAGKPVLMEKPIAISPESAEGLVKAARETGVFCMEGLWSRCFPAMRKAKSLLQSGEIGKVVSSSADFGWNANRYCDDDHRIYDGERGGGMVLDVANYVLAGVMLGAPDAERIDVSAATVEKNGVEISATSTLTIYSTPDTDSPVQLASVHVTGMADTPEEITFVGTHGHLRVHPPAHTPSRVTLVRKATREEETIETFDYPLPADPDDGLGPYNYPGAGGLLYEIETVQKCILSGATECEEWTLNDSLTASRLMAAMKSSSTTPSSVLIPKN
eukprot:CAMPEP_0185743956 /NCGR_PEP_ID=MMETSP1174-20130828/1874_1 /TAXON_ID=35687 /ORGANISM="Dictyocha speculum, Strain CCMP1381" /LENGTH=393 /DNA_ID=CAMNT_0028417015 /DNA_START=139 /DNA_END=1320 /DNA_ORIENTATION=+